VRGLLVALALVAPAGIERAAPEGAQPSPTPDGRLLAYVQNEAKGGTDVYLLDRRSGRRERVSVGSRGQRGTASSLEPSISDSGRLVAFCSYAPNFAPGDKLLLGVYPHTLDVYRDVFVRDRAAKTTTRISVPRGGGQPSGWSCHATISGNGRYVAFVSNAKNLVPGDTDSDPNVYLHDRRSGRTIRLPGPASDAYVGRPALSRDGRWLAYDIGGERHGVYLRDNRTGRVTRVAAGGGVSISADGRVVAYAWGAPRHAFVHDRVTRRTTDLGDADTARIVANGRVVFTYWNDRVVAHDLGAARSARVDPTTFDGMTWQASSLGASSADGRVVAFVSQSSDGLPTGQRRQALFVRSGW
jgi:Tol biopolymer transport system component